MHSRHPARQSLPRLWLMTDERMDDRLLAAVSRLPKGKAGVVWRHYQTPGAERHALYKRIRAIARRNRLTLLLADSPALARAWKADGWHGRTPGRNARLIHSMAAHDRREMVTAARAGADLIFLSPVFATRSHPRARALGPLRFGLLARDKPAPLIALGGMTSSRFRGMMALGADGYAAIDAWL